MDGISINRFVLSKFLGKYRKVCELINDKKGENAFGKDLMTILVFSPRTLILKSYVSFRCSIIRCKRMMDTQEVIILDVREQDEYDSGHIPGAVRLGARQYLIFGAGYDTLQDHKVFDCGKISFSTVLGVG